MSEKKETAGELPEDLAKFRDSYVALFGTLPALPAARFAFSADVDPEALRRIEQLRAHAFYSNVFDVKTTNLILFGMLLVEHHPAAQMDALVPRTRSSQIICGKRGCELRVQKRH